MIFIILLFIPITLGSNIFVDLAQTSNGVHNGTPSFPYSNLTEAVQIQNFTGNANKSIFVFILVKNETSYLFFDEVDINFNLKIMPEFNKYSI